MVAVLLLAGCSTNTASTAGPTPVASSEINVLGASSGSSQATAAVPSTQTSVPSPAAAEGIPTSLGVQVTSAEGATAIAQVKALQIADKLKPVGAKSVAVKHVLFARSGGKQPIDAWMVTFHGGQLPGADGSATSKTGSVTVFVDSKTGDVVDSVAYEPVAK
jgi:hypothetical protein